MSDYILRIIINCLTKLFVKEKQTKARPEVTISTPPRAPSRASSTCCINSVVAHPQRRRGYQTPILKRPPRACPIVRCPSHVSLRRFASEETVSCKQDSIKRVRSLNSMQNKNRKHYNSNPQDLANSSIRTNIDAMKEFPPIRKQMSKVFDDYFVARDRLDAMDDSLAECYENGFLDKRQLCTKNNEFSQAGFSNKTSASSKIPIRHLSKHAARQNPDLLKFPPLPRFTLIDHSPPLDEEDDFEAGGDGESTADNMRFRSSEISNWIAYRNDTSIKFDREFKMFSKKRHTIGNLIDSAAHVQWLKLSGVVIDRDASMFKHFAGGKVVLTIGEYKFLLNKICTIYDLDYWEILRKMATFREQSDALT